MPELVRNPEPERESPVFTHVRKIRRERRLLFVLAAIVSFNLIMIFGALTFYALIVRR